jgi:hypothetical protein
LLHHTLGGDSSDDGEGRSDCGVYVLSNEIDEDRQRQNRSAGPGETERAAYCEIDKLVTATSRLLFDGNIDDIHHPAFDLILARIETVLEAKRQELGSQT